MQCCRFSAVKIKNMLIVSVQLIHPEGSCDILIRRRFLSSVRTIRFSWLIKTSLFYLNMHQETLQLTITSGLIWLHSDSYKYSKAKKKIILILNVFMFCIYLYTVSVRLSCTWVVDLCLTWISKGHIFHGQYLFRDMSACKKGSLSL